MTKIINNKNEEINLYYYQIERFCKNEIEKNKLTDEFQEYSKKYNYFNPYFDFIFNNQKYILYNPLLIPNTVLKNNDTHYSILEENKKMELKTFFDFSLSNDLCLPIAYNIDNIEEGFFILNDGTIITNNFNERHLRTAKTILNLELIKSLSLYKKYLKYNEVKGKYFYYYIVDFLTEQMGIIHGKKINKYFNIIINDKMITQEQLNTINRINKFYKIDLENCNEYNNPKKLIYRNR